MISHKYFYGITWYPFHDNEMRTIYIQFQLLVQLVLYLEQEKASKYP